MELKILEERPNPLLKRVEYRFEVDHPTAATPSRDAVRTELAKAVKAPKERVVIEAMHARYGTAHSVGVGAAYQTADALKAVVREHIQVRNGLKEKAPKGPAATPAAEPAPKPVAVEKAPPEPAKEKAEAKPHEKPPEKPAEKAADKHAEKAEKSEAKPAEKHAEKHADRPEKGEKPAKKAAEKPAESPSPKKEG